MKTKAKTILQIVPALNTGGVEQGTVSLAKALKHKGYRSLVASAGGAMVPFIEKDHVTHYTLPLATKNPINIIRNIWVLKKLIEKEKVDLVHVRSRAPAWSTFFACYMTGTPLVTTFHATYNINFPFKRLYNSIMVRGDAIIAISRYIKKHIMVNYKNYINSKEPYLIERGINMDYYNPDAVTKDRTDKLIKEWKVKKDKPIFLMPARLTRWKGQNTVLKALKLFKDKGHDFTCIFVGSDQGRHGYKQELIAMTKAFELDKNVMFADHCADMAAAYSICDYVIHASTDPEGFGRIIAEGQAMRRLVIATNLGAPAEIIDHGENGLLHAPGNFMDLCSVLEFAFNLGPKKREELIERAYQKAHELYSDQRMFQKTIDIYEALLRTPKKVLVIKHGALGDIIKALGAFQVIRKLFPKAELTLLTTTPYQKLCSDFEVFDHFILDKRSKDPTEYWELMKQLGLEEFDLIIDLQNSNRTKWYRYIQQIGAPTRWWYQSLEEKNAQHIFDGFARLLRLEDASDLAPSVNFQHTMSHPDLKSNKPYALLIPGSSPVAPQKRWPAFYYGVLAQKFLDQGIQPIIIGGSDEKGLSKDIRSNCPGVVDLTGQTSLNDIAGLAQKAVITVGNDTGPTYLSAATNTATLVLWSNYSNPQIHGPKGPKVKIMANENLQELPVASVWQEVEKLIKH